MYKQTTCIYMYKHSKNKILMQEVCSMQIFKGVDQPGHPDRLISAFDIHFLQSMISQLVPCKIQKALTIHQIENNI